MRSTSRQLILALGAVACGAPFTLAQSPPDSVLAERERPLEVRVLGQRIEGERLTLAVAGAPGTPFRVLLEAVDLGQPLAEFQGVTGADGRWRHEFRAPAAGSRIRFHLVGSESSQRGPLVEIGAHVTKGQVVCIIEAMKVMNEIEAESDGELTQILVANGQPVEYGEVLFRLRPPGS